MLHVTPGKFRVLLTLSLLLGFATAIDILLPELIPSEVLEAYENYNELLDNTLSVALLGVVLLVLLLCLPFLVYGLYRIRPWSRKLALYTTIVAVGSIPALGPSLYSGVAETFNYLSAMTWGAILAIMYLSPFSERFETDGKQPPNE